MGDIHNNDAHHPASPSTSQGSSELSGSPHRAISCTKHSDDKREQRLLARIAKESHEHEEASEQNEQNQNSRKVLLMISMTFLFFLVELSVGFINRSIALLADSYHMLSDVMALTIAFLCLRISQRTSANNGFGWVRAEVLGALVNGVFLLAMCFTISLESIGRLLHPRRMQHPFQVLIVGVIGLLINVIGIFLFHGSHGHSHGGGGGHSHGGGGHSRRGGGHGHSHSNGGGHGHSHSNGGGHGHSHGETTAETPDNEKRQPPSGITEETILLQGFDEVRPLRSVSRVSNDCSHNHLALRLVSLDATSMNEDYDDDEENQRRSKRKDEGNLNMRGVFLHILSDALGSVFVIVTASLAFFVPDFLGSFNDYIDPALSLMLVSLISISAYGLVKETAGIILRKTPYFVDEEDLKTDICKIKGVAAVSELKVWTLVANRHICTAKVEFCSPAAFTEAAPKIRHIFHGSGMHSLTMQPVFSSVWLFHNKSKYLVLSYLSKNACASDSAVQAGPPRIEVDTTKEQTDIKEDVEENVAKE